MVLTRRLRQLQKGQEHNPRGTAKPQASHVEGSPAAPTLEPRRHDVHSVNLRHLLQKRSSTFPTIRGSL